MNINIKHLKYLCDTIRYRSVSIAAKKNFVSQSAVSQAIDKLEEVLNLKLVSYDAKQLNPTNEGEIVFEKGQNIFYALTNLEEALDFHKKEYCGQVEIACMHSVALALLPKYLKQIKDQYPLINFTFQLGHTDTIRKWLKNGEIDFGIVLDNEDLSDLDCFEILSGEYRLYSSSRFNLKDFDKTKIILSEDRPETNKLKDLYFKKFNKQLAGLMQVSSWEVIANFVEEDLGIGFIPDYVAVRRKNKLKVVDLDLEPILYRLFIVLRKNTQLTKNIKAIIELFCRPLE